MISYQMKVNELSGAFVASTDTDNDTAHAIIEVSLVFLIVFFYEKRLFFLKIFEEFKKKYLNFFVFSQMLRLAEMTFNALSDVDFDVLLGTRDLPPMEMATMMWNLNRISCEILKDFEFKDEKFQFVMK